MYTTVYGCSQGFYKNNGGYTLDMTLAEAGFITNVKPCTTLLQVISNPKKYDGYLRQAVTSHLNAYNSEMEGFEYPWSTTEVVAGYNNGTVTQADFEYYNHGATGEFIIADCPLD